MGYFGKAIALLFYTEILNKNTAFLVHKNTYPIEWRADWNIFMLYFE